MDKTREVIYLRILKAALWNIRSLGEEGKAADCALEAEHVHNIPEFLDEYDERRERYYWQTERVAYLKHADPRYSNRFNKLWSELSKPADNGS